MKLFLESVWQDLREKRLWPVAALLLIAVVAIPVVLIKPAKQTGPVQSAAAPAKEKVPALTPISDAARAGEGSGLGVFKKGNPFLPPKSVLAATKDSGTTAGSSTVTSSQAGAGATGSGSASGGGTGSSGGSAPTSGGGGDTTGGQTPGSGGEAPKTVKYTYVADVTFTSNGHARHISGLKRLSMLPNESSPLLVFLGVDSSADNAVFLVDSTLGASGEGHCTPSDKDCGVLTIGAGSVEEFSDEQGHSYKLRIDEIRKVKVSSASASARASHRSKSARAAGAPTRRLELTLLTDLVTVASPAAGASSSRQDSR